DPGGWRTCRPDPPKAGSRPSHSSRSGRRLQGDAVRSLRGRLFVATARAVLVSIPLTLGVGVALTRGSVRRSILTQLGRQADLVAVRVESARLTDAQLRAVRALFQWDSERLLILSRTDAGLE